MNNYPLWDEIQYFPVAYVNAMHAPVNRSVVSHTRYVVLPIGAVSLQIQYRNDGWSSGTLVGEYSLRLIRAL